MSKFANTSRRRFHLGVALATIIAWACGEGTEPQTDTGNDTNLTGETGEAGVSSAAVLDSVADHALAPTFAEFATAAESLESAAGAYATAVRASQGVDAARQVVLDEYRAAMTLWQVAEVMQLGPAAGSDGVGAEFLRDEIYSWPSVNTCRVDQELALGEYSAADFAATRLVNVYGFDVLEYLLFSESLDNTCPPQLPINQGEWSALGDEEVQARRAEYAAVVASDIRRVADALAAAWAPGGAWNAHLKAPMDGPYQTFGAAMDEVLRAMFYIDKVLKDAKIARPGGIKDCGSSSCPDAVESLFAGLSKPQAVANLEGFRRLFLAGLSAEDGTGFDELLGALGEGALADEMLQDLDAAQAAIEGVRGTFVEAVQSDPDALTAAHSAVAALTDNLKGDFATVLMLNIPSEAAGDAD